MGDGDSVEAGSTAMLQRLRASIRTGREREDDRPGWRDDLRLFGMTWALGFMFFLVVLA